MEIVPLAGDKKSYKCDFSSKTLSFRFMEILSIVWCIKFNGKKKLYSISCYWIILKYLPINFRHGVRVFFCFFFEKLCLNLFNFFLAHSFIKVRGTRRIMAKVLGSFFPWKRNSKISPNCFSTWWDSSSEKIVEWTKKNGEGHHQTKSWCQFWCQFWCHV